MECFLKMLLENIEPQSNSQILNSTTNALGRKDRSGKITLNIFAKDETFFIKINVEFFCHTKRKAIVQSFHYIRDVCRTVRFLQFSDFISIMRSIFSRYYKEDKDVTEDVELQTYVNEVSLNGSGPNGGLGRVNMTITHKTHLGCRLRGLILVYTFVHRTQDVQNLWWLKNTTPNFL